jgi:DNA-binding response OmpR family regulator/two-component sensor histidine kinase
MMRNAGRLEQLIDQLLDLARLEAGRLPLRWQYGDCRGFLRLFATSLRSLPAQRHITYETLADGEPVLGWHDQDLLEKVVGNLVVNAVKHTPGGGAVRISIEIGPEGPAMVPGSAAGGGEPVRARPLTITVFNTGSYIPPHEIACIFDRFHQVHAAEGFGVGLALVRELVELLGGCVTAASEEAVGTTFTVALPVYLDSPTGEPNPATATPAEIDSGGPGSAAGEPTEEPEDDDDEASEEPCVLVVEDQQDLLDFMAGDLAGQYRVLKAVDGRAGLRLAVEEIPDLVLSDVMMPELNGFELCDALKRDERTSHIPVILLTARADIESRHEGLRLGADDYLGKPFDLEDLRLRIHNLIEQRRRVAESFQRRLALEAPGSLSVTSADERFIQQLREAIDARLDDESFRITELCREVGMSRSQLHRKLRAVTGKSASGFVRTHRLQRAAQMFEGGYGNVTEVAYAAGFHNLSYFSRSFRDLYGVQPSEYLRDRKGRAPAE